MVYAWGHVTAGMVQYMEIEQQVHAYATCKAKDNYKFNIIQGYISVCFSNVAVRNKVTHFLAGVLRSQMQCYSSRN